MLTTERQEEIISLLKQKHSVTISELEHRFAVSSETVRRDLLALESKKQLIRVHGGAISINAGDQGKNLKKRHEEMRPEKQELCEYAIRFIQEDDVICIDSGSTASVFCELLAARFEHLTVVVNSILLFQILSQNQGFHIILCGGEYESEEGDFYGEITIKSIKSLRVSKGFLAPVGVSLEYGITGFRTTHIETQRAFYEIAEKAFIIADSNKFETCGLYSVLPISDDMTFITDHNLSDEIYQKYLESDIDIIRHGE